jgi:hypothetical protein
MFFALVDLLRYNDELNNSFKTFDTYMQERERRFNGSARPVVPSHAPLPTISPTRARNDVPALIRFDDDPVPLNAGFQNMRAYLALFRSSIRRVNASSRTVVSQCLAEKHSIDIHVGDRDERRFVSF